MVNALAPAEVAKVVLDEEAERIEAVVPDDQLSLAIGRRGQNVRLASQLTGWDIDIMTEAEECERRQKEFAERTQRFIEALDADEMLAQLLASEGFDSVEEIAYVEEKEIASIDGLDEDTASEIQGRAREYLAKIAAEQDAKRRELGVEDDVAEVDGRHPGHAGRARRSRHPDAGGPCRLCHRRPDRLDRAQAGRDGEAQGAFNGLDVRGAEAEAVIMAARVKAGWIEPETVAPAATERSRRAAARGGGGRVRRP